MLNVSSAIKTAYKSGNANTAIFLTINNTEYDPTNILAGSVSITESLCSSSQFDISRVEKNSLSFTLFNISENISDLQGKTVVATQEITLAGSSTPTVIPLGTYTIISAVNDGDNLYKCECYDSTMLAFDQIIDDWWNTTLTFPVTLRGLAVALFTHLGVSANVPATFTNYDYSITARPVYFQGVTAAELLGYIQEVAGGFFKADRNGTIQFYSIQEVSVTDDSIIISDGNAGKEEYTYRQIVSDLYIADYEVSEIDKLQVRGTEDDIGIIVGTGTNAYIITGNVLMYTLTESTGSAVVTNIFNAIKDMHYIPFSARVMALTYVEVGDGVSITTLKSKNATAPLMQRVLSGSKLCFDAFTANGEEEREEVTSVNRELKTLNQKTHEIINTVEEFSSTITDIQSDITDLDTLTSTHTTEISQNAAAIALKVSTSDYNANEIINMINLDTSGLKIQATHINIDTTTLNLTFGSQQTNVTIQSTTDNDGVLFDGNGKVEFETNGQFRARNLDSQSRIANYIRLTSDLTDTTLNLDYNFATLVNCYQGNDKNWLNMRAYSDRTYTWYVNNRPTAQANANNINMNAGSSSYYNAVRNFAFNRLTSDNGVISANNVYLESTANYNFAGLRNYNYDGNLTNYVNLWSRWETNNTYNGIYIFNTDNSQRAANNITLLNNSTDNHIYITNKIVGSSDTANEIQLEGNTSGYVSYWVKNYDRTNHKVANMIFLSSRPYSHTIEGAVIPANNSLNLVNYQPNANLVVNSKITMNDNISFQCQNRVSFTYNGNGKQFFVNGASNGVAIGADGISDTLLEAGKIYLVAPNGLFVIDQNGMRTRQL